MLIVGLEYNCVFLKFTGERKNVFEMVFAVITIVMSTIIHKHKPLS